MPNDTETPTRPSLFTRPEELPPFRPTPRDVLITRNVARFRLLRQDQIKRLVGGSDDNVGRRTRLLFKYGFLDLPPVQRQQLAHVFETGNFPLVYALGLKGAQLIAPTAHWINAKLDWTLKNKNLSGLFLAHTTEVAQFVIELDQACARHGSLTLYDHHDLLPMMPPETTRPKPNHNPFKLSPIVTLTTGGRHKVEKIRLGGVPDRLLSLASGAARKNYVYEHDTGEMDVDPPNITKKSSIRRKHLVYWHAWRQNLHNTTWGFQNFRVLYETPSEARMQHMISIQRREEITPDGTNLFLFTTPARLKSHGVLGPAWVSGKGQTVSIADDLLERA